MQLYLSYILTFLHSYISQIIPQDCMPAVPAKADSTVIAKRSSSVQNFLFFITLENFKFRMFHILDSHLSPR